MISTMVLGLGNLVHADDGVGVHAIERLRRDKRVPGDVALLDGGTLGLELLANLGGVQRLLVVDAIDVEQPAGTLLRFEGDALRGLPGKASVHQLGFADLMIAMELLGDRPAEVVVLGVQPASTDWGAELTPAVSRAMDPLLDLVVEQLAMWRGDAASVTKCGRGDYGLTQRDAAVVGGNS